MTDSSSEPTQHKTSLDRSTLPDAERRDLENKATQFVDQLLRFDVKEMEAKQSRKASIETMGLDLQMKAAKQSELLQQPLKKLNDHSEDGGAVASSLAELKLKVEELDPGKFDFEPGWFGRLLAKLPGVGSPLKRYFTQFESAQTVISAVVRSLESGRDQLVRDNVTLEEDQKQMRATSQKLEHAILLGQLVDERLQLKLDREIPAGDPKHSFVAEELVFPLRQRLMDLQQQLAVNQQGVVATELIVRNNQELVRGVNRALNVTVAALRVGATVAMALANQKIVLEKVSAVNQTTSDLIAGTAARLKTQGTEIHRQASQSQLNMDSLRTAFADLRSALQQISEFRTQALPQMAQTMQEMDRLNGEAKRAIEQMDRGNRVRPEITLDVEG